MPHPIQMVVVPSVDTHASQQRLPHWLHVVVES